MTTLPGHTVRILPGTFEAKKYWYDKAHEGTIHPLLHLFLHLDQSRLIKRYSQLYPDVDAHALEELLNYHPQFFHWAGADLIHVTTASGQRDIVVIENNSCPSGQKSMPVPDDHHEQGGYRGLIEKSFKPFCERQPALINGALAVIYDKNEMENAGYAAAMADVFNEPVFLVEYKNDQSAVRFKEGILEVRDGENTWHPIRAAFRYVTQKPWNRIPIFSRTRIFNPVIACLAGGRNKLVASKAYSVFNTEIASAGLKINLPETIWDISRDQVPMWVKKLGGHAVVKVPYSNAGMGVYTILTKRELDHFMKEEFEYDKFIVQALIGNSRWARKSGQGRLYHVGMVPGQSGQSFVFDMRMMICGTPDGMKPLVVYSRRAEEPLRDTILPGDSSWKMLGTNLSSFDADGEWQTDTSRLLVMDRNESNSLGLSLDDLIKAFIQTVLSTIAIDKMAQKLVTPKGYFRQKFFASFDDDKALINQIRFT